MISIVKPMQPQTVGVNTARYHDHEEPIRWWSHVTEHGKVVLKTCKEQPCPRYLSWPPVRLKCQKYFQHSKLFVAHFLFSGICCENEPVHKCIRLHINRDGKVDNLKTMDDKRNIVGGNLHSLPGHSEGSRPKQHLLVNHLPDNLNVALQMSNWAWGIR